MAIHPPIQERRMLISELNTNEVGRMPVAREVMEEFENLAGRASELAQYVNDKLSTVMRPELPENPCSVSKDPQYPPLFAALHDSGQSIKIALDAIERAMSRTEL